MDSRTFSNGVFAIFLSEVAYIGVQRRGWRKKKDQQTLRRRRVCDTRHLSLVALMGVVCPFSLLLFFFPLLAEVEISLKTTEIS